ncbi:hypothetical protein PGT21_006311 [Puccinia graminis f. sp. tritici]|uniref:Oxysterol binding protein n=1 Tax=Puccinia graminis f. sp. tritici TaxID=56615 RepID=A0A5B0NBQ5_PUCGR|nr:hypothetical protein PGT21_006311 [Puccinia graminis f. sp. tritici]KAA1118370.1 hypothetical protein PGTUg99_003489 [Puccinia graminis f. sp. tritici]
MPSLSRSSSSNSHPNRNNSPSTNSINLENRNTSSLATDSAEPQDDTKFKQLLAVLKKAIGVKDMGAMRLSLPAHLITPVGNLEYWCYLDRPDLFAAINDSEDDFERMLAVLRWTLTKDCKFVHGPVCKPYNSVLGEQFRCIYDVIPSKVDPESGDLIVYETPSRATSPTQTTDSGPTRAASFQTTSSSTALDSEDPGPLRDGNRSGSSLATTVNKSSSSARVVFLNEQVSHHPPISCFWYEARPKTDGQPSKPLVIAHGVDQISAKFTGTSVKVFPGPMNKGIFVKLPNRNEEYEITHPTAMVTGLIRANPYVVITDYAYITCRSAQKRRFRTMINYVDESWVGKAKFALEGVIYELQETDDPNEWTKIKQVPSDRIWCKFSGSWRGVVTYTMTEASRRTSGSSQEQQQSNQARELVDLSSLEPLPKTVKPEAHQTEMESRKFWKSLTSLIQAQNFTEATKEKQTIEQNQRDLSNKRKADNQPFKPLIFNTDDDENDNDDNAVNSDSAEQLIGLNGYAKFSKPILTPDGVKILEAEFKGIGYDDPPLDN